VAAVGTISPDWDYPAPGKVALTLENAFKEYIAAYLERAQGRLS
jgi:hypothetical protein